MAGRVAPPPLGHPPRHDPSAKSVRALGERWIAAIREHRPVQGASLGFEACEGRLPEPGDLPHTAMREAATDLQCALEAIPSHALERDALLDRRLLLAEARCLLAREESDWQRDPLSPADFAIDALFHLVRLAGQSRITKNLIEKIESILAATPGYLKKSLKGLHRPVPLWQANAHSLAVGAANFVEEITSDFAAHAQDPRRFRRLARAAATAYRFYAEAQRDVRPGPSDSFAVGADRLALLIRERLGLDLQPREIEALGWDLIRRFQGEMKEEAASLGADCPTTLLERLRKEWRVPNGNLLKAYTEQAHHFRQAVIEHGLVSLPPNESLEVRLVPHFMRGLFPTAAYTAPGPFAQQQQGIFWVNDLSLGKRGAAALRERQQHFGLSLTCAHEGYPGHHLQFAWQNCHPSPVRRLASHAIFYEGWTLWCEHLVVTQKLDDSPSARLLRLHDALWRACRVVIDVGIQTKTMTLQRACHLLKAEVQFTPARAMADLSWYSRSPTVPMSYLLGFLEMERLYHSASRASNMTLRGFHDRLMTYGAIPFAWFREDFLFPVTA